VAAEEPDVNRRYFVHYVNSVAAPGAKVLDYGCGHGTLVGMFLDAGFDAFGCDIRWPGAEYTLHDTTELGKSGRLHYFESGGRLPFDDDTFDVIVSDQVFEHVSPIEASVREIERVVKPDGVMYHHFPSRSVIREGHIGLPWSHRLPKGRARLAYATLLRRLGLGIFKDDRPAAEWAAEKLEWIDNWTEYRSAKEIHEIFGRHATLRHREIEYCRFRAAEQSPLLGALLARPRLVAPAERAFRRLGFDAIEARPAG
jgi:SAM-dependent methyltransferase